MDKIVGFRRAVGEFEGKPYDNIYLVTIIHSRKYYGYTTTETKVKTRLVLEALENVPDGDFLEEHYEVLLGARADFFFNRYGQVSSIEFETDDTDNKYIPL